MSEKKTPKIYLSKSNKLFWKDIFLNTFYIKVISLLI